MQRQLTHSGALYTGAGAEGSTTPSKMEELKDWLLRPSYSFICMPIISSSMIRSNGKVHILESFVSCVASKSFISLYKCDMIKMGYYFQKDLSISSSCLYILFNLHSIYLLSSFSL